MVDIGKGSIAIIWCIEDVDSVIADKRYRFEPRLSRNEKMKVLEYIENHHDANIGVNWDVIEDALMRLYGERITEK